MIPAAGVMLGVVWLMGQPLLHWLSLGLAQPAWLFALLYVAPSLSLPLSYLIGSQGLRSFLHRLGECWFGLFLYLTMAFLLEAAVLGLLSLFGVAVSTLWRLRAGWLAVAAFIVCYGYGVINALHIHVKRINISLPVQRPHKFVLASDLHLGFFTGQRMLPRMEEAILREEPEAALLAGDIFDMEYQALRQPERQMQVLARLCGRLPVYACGGNHDLLFDDPRKDAFMAGSGLIMLRDQWLDLGDLVLLGRRDVMDDSRKQPQEVYAGLPKAKPLLVLDHNPRAFKEAWRQGASLVLSGHSHGGQTFPGNLLQRLVMPYPIYGHHQEQGRHLVVTSGAGFWGPPLRVRVNNEIVVISLTPES